MSYADNTIEGFKQRLNAQVDRIAKDKPIAARKFKNDLLDKSKKYLICPSSIENPFFSIEKMLEI